MNNSEVEHKWFHWANYLTMLRGVVVHFLNNSLPTSHWIYISNGTFSFQTRHNWMDQIFSNYIVNDKQMLILLFLLSADICTNILNVWWRCVIIYSRPLMSNLVWPTWPWLCLQFCMLWPKWRSFSHLLYQKVTKWLSKYQVVWKITEIFPFMPDMIILLPTLFNNFLELNSSCQSNCKSWKEALDTNITHISQFDFSVISFEGYKMSAWRGKANWESS